MSTTNDSEETDTTSDALTRAGGYITASWKPGRPLRFSVMVYPAQLKMRKRNEQPND